MSPVTREWLIELEAWIPFIDRIITVLAVLIIILFASVVL